MRISILLEALTGKFETDVQRAGRITDREFKKMQREAAAFGRQLGVALVAGATALALITKRSVEFADGIAKTADKLGIGIEALQEYRFAAGRAGVEQGNLDKSLEIFNRRIGETAQGTGEGKVAFDQLGISIRDAAGNMRPAEDILRDVADALGRLPSQAERAAVANQLFGRSGAGMLNVLKDGSKGLDDYARAARNLGVVIDENLVRDAEKAADKMGDLSLVLKTNIATAVLQNTDSIISLTEALIGFVNKAAEAPRLMRFIGESFAARFSGAAIDDLVRLEDQLAEMLALKNLPALSPSRLRFFGPEGIVKFYDNAELDQAIAEVKARIEASLPAADPVISPTVDQPPPLPSAEFLALAARLQEQIALYGQVGEAAKLSYAIQSGALDALSGAEQQEVLALARRYDALVAAGEAQKQLAAEEKRLADERARQVEEVGRMVAALDEQAAVLGLSETQADLYRFALAGATDEQLRHAKAVLDTIQAHNELQDLVRQAEQVFDATRDPLERFNAEIERLNTLRDTFVDGKPLIDGETYQRAVAQAQDAFDDATKKVSELDEFTREAFQRMQGHLADFLFEPWKDGLDGMLTGLIQTLQRMTAEIVAAQLLKQLFGGFANSGNPLLASLGQAAIAGTRDSGGRGSPGSIYAITPRAGTELFIPDTAGTFFPNAQRWAGNNFSMPITVMAPEGRITRESEGRLRSAQASAMVQLARRNG